MKRRAWPFRSDGSRSSPALPLPNINGTRKDEDDRATTHRTTKLTATRPSWISPVRQIQSRSRPRSSTSTDGGDFSELPYDVLTKIAASFGIANLRTASLVCKSWYEALRPLREAMLLLRWGKRFKHGRGGVRPNLEKALDSFLEGAARGSTLAMVDAGLMYWESGKRDQAMALYHKAAALGDPAGQFNLGCVGLIRTIVCVAEPANSEEAVRWLHQSAVAGYVRAQYQLALCLHRGRGVDNDMQEAARWYLKAAEGGYVRAMYNVSLCYSFGEGLGCSHRQARKWMKRAADHGHTKAQFEHGLALFSEGDMLKAVVYLELATRAGETAAAHVKNVILQQLSATSRDRVLVLADHWRALPATS
ncbi:Eukaryotic elongation factor 2 kinase [Parasponia andersonii]|uniref:Eukaryotic elongation factor 2 kinase n=1 Tax=Parasponia andersonii TaxID=3476 RepID=A0A2P5BWK1_PARAD|nr:Eukaryotic elongation factor 2 kinase [Parasponia andersonii]